MDRKPNTSGADAPDIKPDDPEYMLRLLMLGPAFTSWQRGNVFSQMRQEGKNPSGDSYSKGWIDDSCLERLHITEEGKRIALLNPTAPKGPTSAVKAD